VPAILARISFSGELGYEIYVEPTFQLKLAEAIEEAGADLGLRWYGSRALMSLRLEKGWGAWTLDFRPDFSAAESGLDAFINWDKDFVGKPAALAESGTGATKKLVTMVVDTDDIDVCNDEAIMEGGEAVGYVSSGGYAHHVGKSVALGYVPTELAAAGRRVEVEIMGQRYPAEILSGPLYDANGGRMRS
jgi:dimethylglycine dehydrogenase